MFDKTITFGHQAFRNSVMKVPWKPMGSQSNDVKLK